LEGALRSSREIGMAVGVLMGRGGVTQDEAFAMLHRRVAAPAPDNSPDSRCNRGGIDLSSKRTGSA
jgi:ANTAR domain